MVLNLVQLVIEKTGALRVLGQAYDKACIEGGTTVGLDALLEAARAEGFYGSRELAAGVLRMSGRFQIERDSVSRRQAIRPSTALVPVSTMTRSTALVPVSSALAGNEMFLAAV